MMRREEAGRGEGGNWSYVVSTARFVPQSEQNLAVSRGNFVPHSSQKVATLSPPPPKLRPLSMLLARLFTAFDWAAPEAAAVGLQGRAQNDAVTQEWSVRF
jgi:hypothetical protein